MGKKLKKPQQEEEVDLGQLFKLIGNGFRNFFNFIGSILNNLFLAFVWTVFFFKKHLIKIVIASIIGFVLGYAKEKFVEPIYKSEMVILQNYNTGENLYSTIDYINQLIFEQDSIGLGNNLRITPNKANSISELEVEPILNDNLRMSLFDEYTKSLDSVLASGIDFKTFVRNFNDYLYSRQKITLWSNTKETSTEIITEIIKNVENIGYFKNEQKKDLVELSRIENAIKESLKQSDSLQKVYKEVLIKSVEPSTVGSQTSVTIDNTEDKGITKEFELYNSDLELRRELVDIERAKEDKEYIIEIISSQQDNGTLFNATVVFGFEFSYKVAYAILLVLLVVGVLFALEFLNFLERYKSKI